MTVVPEVSPRVVVVEDLPTGAFPVARLLPEQVMQDKRIARARLMAMAGIGAAVLAVGGLWMTSSGEAAEAEQQLSDAQTQAAVLAAQQAKYSDVPAIASQLANAQQDISTALGPEVLWSGILGDLKKAAPAGVTIAKVSGSLPAATSSSASKNTTAGTTGTTTEPAAGHLIVGGEAATYPAIASWLDSLAAQKVFSGPTLTKSSKDPNAANPAVSFESTVELTAAAKSGRYVTKGTS